MAIQKIWDEEAQEFVYDDPDVPEDFDPTFGGEFQWGGVAGGSVDDLERATLPLCSLERLCHEKRFFNGERI